MRKETESDLEFGGWGGGNGNSGEVRVDGEGGEEGIEEREQRWLGAA